MTSSRRLGRLKLPTGDRAFSAVRPAEHHWPSRSVQLACEHLWHGRSAQVADVVVGSSPSWIATLDPGLLNLICLGGGSFPGLLDLLVDAQALILVCAGPPPSLQSEEVSKGSSGAQ